MSEEWVEQICRRIGELIQWSCHDGLYDLDRQPWEQKIDDLQYAWRSLTDPSNLEALRRRRDVARIAEWRQLFDEAVRQAELRAATRPEVE